MYFNKSTQFADARKGQFTKKNIF